MPSAPSDIEAAEDLVSDRPRPTEIARRSFIKGLAILLPLVITLLVFSLVFGFIAGALDPLVVALQATPLFDAGSDFPALVVTVAGFVLVVLAIGFAAEYGGGDGRLEREYNEFMTSIPGVGAVYNGFNEMSELLFDPDTDSFQDVKLVEYPGADSYVVAFKTAETADSIAEATGNDDMVTLFMPMAPNPVMGGFVIHVSRDRVVDVDLTVEEGIRSIVTSGVAVGEQSTETNDVSASRMNSLGLGDDGTSPNERHEGETDNASTDTNDSGRE